MNNCYCGHPEKSHSRKHRVNYFDDNIHGNGTRYLSVFSHACYNCICLKFIEKAESQEPKALEEYGDTWCACSMFGEVHKKSSHDKAKPQEEPEGGFGIDKAVEDLSGYIILPRPKGWRIGQTIWNFKEWLRLTHEVKDFFYMTDDEWNRRWNEYLTSIKSQE